MIVEAPQFVGLLGRGQNGLFRGAVSGATQASAKRQTLARCHWPACALEDWHTSLRTT